MRHGIRIVVGCAAIALGCSSASSTSGGLTGNAQSFCMAILNATVDRAYACEGGAREAYTAQIQALDFCNTAGAIIGASHVAFDADAAAACVADFAHLECWQNANASTSCRKVFTGTIPEGGVCYPSLPMGAQECVPGTICSAVGTDCTGTCVPGTLTSRPVAIGMACTGSSTCVGDEGALTCAGPNGPIASGAGTCQAPADSGPCFYDSDCSSNVCQGAIGTTAGTCQAAKRLGDTCEPSAGQCGPGTYCVPGLNTCISLPAVGQQCAGDSGVINQCLDGFCDSSTMCVRFGRKGELCQPNLTDSCGLGMNQCDSTTLQCTPVCMPGNGCGAPGQMCCAGQRCNAGAVCDNRTCR
jgi:hypothetical protein